MTTLCKCGSTVFVKSDYKLNCRGCGVFAVKQPESLYIFGMNLKEDTCANLCVSPQEQLIELKKRQVAVRVGKSAHRSDALGLIKRGVSKFKMTAQTAQLAVGYFDQITLKAGR